MATYRMLCGDMLWGDMLWGDEEQAVPEVGRDVRREAAGRRTVLVGGTEGTLRLPDTRLQSLDRTGAVGAVAPQAADGEL